MDKGHFVMAMVGLAGCALCLIGANAASRDNNLPLGIASIVVLLISAVGFALHLADALGAK